MSEFINTRVAEIYRIKYQIERGSFGIVFAGINLKTGCDVAIKVENMSVKYPQLYQEYLTYKALKGHEGFAKVFCYTQERNCNILVMERLGQSLNDLFGSCGGIFTLKCVLMIADQMLTRLEDLHEKGFIHRDVKPSNILVGTESAVNMLYLIDFGMAMKYRNVHTNEHIKYGKVTHLFGTALFASVSAGLQYQQSRKDDLESLGYLLVYFYKGKLPWSKIHTDNKDEKFSMMTKIKKEISSDLLFLGMPKVFKIYMDYCKNLKFHETPDYGYLRGLFKSVFYRKNYSYDLDFDWGLDV